MAARKAGRWFTGEQKLKFLEEARQPKTTMVLQRHGLDATTESV